MHDKSNFVIDWLLEATDQNRWNFVDVFCHFNANFFLMSPGSAEANIGRDGNLNSHSVASCGRNMSAKKLLKSDNHDSSYSQ